MTSLNLPIIKPKDPENPLATFFLRPLVRDLLRGEYYIPISEDTAEIILMHYKNQRVCHVQYPSDQDVDILGKPIDTPILWEIGAWQTSSEKWLKGKIRSEKEREERFILDANINLVARCILKMAYINPDAARVIARKCILNKDFVRIKAFGCARLYKTIKELP